MTLIGMDVEAVNQLGKDLTTQADQVNQITSRIDQIVRQLPAIWKGTDAQRFVDWWTNQHRPSLRAAHDAIQGLGQSAKNNAEDQARASGPAAPVSGHAGVADGSGPGGSSATPPSTSAADVSVLAQATQGPQAYSVDNAIAKALAEDGTSRPTGDNAPGECIKSVQRWINEAGGHFGGGGAVSGYVNSGAVAVAIGEVVKGDVIQYTSLANPDDFDPGVHTVMVTGVNADGSYQIAQSNANYTGTVSLDQHWTPHPPSGFEARVWRFGQH